MFNISYHGDLARSKDTENSDLKLNVARQAINLMKKVMVKILGA